MTERPEMCEFLLLMHSDAERAGSPEEWDAYFKRLSSADRFRGGSAESLVPGNPVFEAGGTVEVREFPRS
jgi:hypothetical protein